MSKRLGKLIIGLTGSFGSGKSTVAGFFEVLGARVLNADKMAHEALEPSSPVFKKILECFGTGILTTEGSIDRKKLSDVVFQDAGKRRELEALIHPHVFEKMQQEIECSSSAVVVLDVPLLFESNMNAGCDYAVVVNAPDESILERLCRKGFSKEEVFLRTQAQWPISEKVRAADFVIQNHESQEETRKQVEAIWKTLIAVK